MFSSKIAKQDVCEGQEFAVQGVPDASLIRFSLYVRAIAAAALHAEHDLLLL